MKRFMFILALLALALCIGSGAAEGSLLEAAAALNTAETNDDLLAMHAAIAREYAAELEAGSWDINLDFPFPQTLPDEYDLKNTENAVSTELPAEIRNLRFLTIYKKENQSPILLGSFQDRLPAVNRTESFSEVQAVLLLQESFEAASNYTGSAFIRNYDFYVWKPDSNTVWHIAQRYTTPPHAGRGTLYGEEIPLHDLWLIARDFFFGNSFVFTDDHGNELTFEITGDYSCSLTGVTLAEGETELSVPPQVNGLTVTEIGTECMKKNETIQSVSLPRGVARISASAFYSCANLVRVDLPDTLEIISDSAFCSCEKLRDLEIPDSVKVIENAAFRCCYALESLRIPASLQQETGSPFQFIEKVARIVVSEGVQKIDSVPPTYGLACCYLPSTLKYIKYMPIVNSERAVFYAPADSYAYRWLTENGYSCVACESPDEMPQVEYVMEGDLEYRLFDGEAAVYACRGSADGYIIPDQVAGYPVTKLLYHSFNRVECDYIIVPAGVKLIDECAISNNKTNPCVAHLYITSPETEISSFNYSEKATIHAPEGSLAQAFAEKNDFRFEAWDGKTLDFELN